MKWQRPKDRIVRAAVLVLFDVCVQVADVDEERRALAVVEVGQVSILDEPPELPLAYAEVLGSLSCAEKAILNGQLKTHEHLN
jgi:hypothetical protein